jgi:hypothetical protein
MKASRLEKANGVNGQLLFLNKDRTPYVRVYNRVTGTYDDYKLCVDDLTFIINSNYFAFVTYPDGTKQLEYTTGRKEV